MKIPETQKRPWIGEKTNGGTVIAMGILAGERYVITRGRFDTVGFWPVGTWDEKYNLRSPATDTE